MTMNCKSCGLDKPEAEMFTLKGKPIRTCRQCKQKQFKVGIATRAKTMQSANISAPVKADALPVMRVPLARAADPEPAAADPAMADAPATDPPAPPAAAAAEIYPALTILPGWGVNAAVDDGFLVIKQSDAEGNTDTIMLSQPEARTLFAHFHAWAE